MRISLYLAAVAIGFLAVNSSATTRFVDVNNPNPVAPYTNWLSAATNIQDAVDAATGFGDAVLVTNGIYRYGGAAGQGSNRVVIAAGLLVQSVNGPAVTTIQGYQVPVTTNGPGAMRCVYIHEFGRLAGFTLTGGATASSGVGETVDGGGLLTDTQCSVSNCIIAGNASSTAGGGAFLAGLTGLTNCIIAGNSVSNGAGGGVYGANTAALVDCVISNNSAGAGGGVGSCTVYSSLLVGNSAGGGGAAYVSTLNNCTLTGNSSGTLGAADACKLQNSIIYYNANGLYADCYQCKLSDCCTTIGMGTSTLPAGCISNAPSFVNAAAGDYHLNPWSRCLDAGNNSFTTNSLDLDGNPRIAGAAVDMGAYEMQSSFQVTAHYVSLLSTNPVTPYTNWSTAATNIQDAVGVAQSGEFVIADDGVYTNGSTVVFGTESNRVALTNAITLTSAGGPQAAIITGGNQMRCVYVGANATLIGFTLTNGHASFSGSITNEQAGGGAWCASGAVVSNCVAAGNVANSGSGLGGGIFGGTIWNCVLTNNNAFFGSGVAVASLYNCMIVSNGWQSGNNSGGGLYAGTASNCTFTANRGYMAGGGVYRSTLFNCALNTNVSSLGGGGAYSSLLYGCALNGNQGFAGGTHSCTNYNCTFTGNLALQGGGANQSVSYSCVFTRNSATSGGGASGGSAYNCIFSMNRANSGGGAICRLLNCTVVGNTATNNGGGVIDGTGSPVDNSIVYYNTCLNNPAAANGPSGTTGYTCTTPLPFLVANCFTNEPLFVNWTNGDFHLQSNSPCINSGAVTFLTNGFVFAILTNDFDGNPRIIGSAPDVGAYEFPSPASMVSYAWLLRYGFPTDGSSDNADSDGDGMSNYAEWRAGTNPTNAASLLALQIPVMTGTSATVTWQSGSGIYYFIQRTPDLFAQPFQTIASNIYGSAITTSYTDTNAASGSSVFYRVGIQ